MIFASDNWAGAHPRIAANMAKHAAGYTSAYGSSDLDRQITDRFSIIFEREVAVFYVSTGTAANALALTSVNRPAGVSFVHDEAHLIADEAGASEYLTGGARLCPVPGENGLIDPEELEEAIARYPAQFLHGGRPMAISITQSTECGTVYDLARIAAIAAIARKNDLPLHMDGARFANALVSLGVTPADMTWRRGVDILSFGGTKNGCWCAEAVVLFDPARAAEFAFIHKRAAQLYSKSRFVSAQFEAYFEDELWLETAKHANAMAAKVADLFRESRSTRLAWTPDANEVFAVMGSATAGKLRKAGAAFHDWTPPRSFSGILDKDEGIYRFVTSFATTDADVEKLAAHLG